MKLSRALAMVFVIALMLRIGVAFWLPAEVVWPDGARYERVAMTLLIGQGFGNLEDNKQSVPTQPLLIAAVYTVFGESYLALRVFFATLGACSCVLGSLLASRVFGERVGVLAGLMLAGYPFLVYLSALFEYPQTFYILVMALFFLFFYRFRATRSRASLFLSAACLGLGILSVPTTLIFAVAFGVLLIARDWRETFVRISVCALAASLTVGPWVVRNYLAYDQLILVNAAGGGAFWLGNNETYWRFGKEAVVPACAPGFESSVFCQQIRELEQELALAQLDDVDYVLTEQSRSWENGLRFVREDPSRFVMLTIRKLIGFLGPVPDAVHDQGAYGGDWRELVAAASYLPVLILAVFGVALTRARWQELMPVYVYLATFIAPYAVFFPATRYRMPVDFVLLIFAAVAMHWVWSEFVRRRSESNEVNDV